MSEDLSKSLMAGGCGLIGFGCLLTILVPILGLIAMVVIGTLIPDKDEPAELPTISADDQK